MNLYKCQIILILLLLSSNARAQKYIDFTGKWCSNLQSQTISCWDITIDQNHKKAKSTLEVFMNQLYYHCTNKLKGDTLLFYFESYEGGLGGLSEINSGKIKIPIKGKLFGKAIVKSDKLVFIYKANKMNLNDSYIRTID